MIFSFRAYRLPFLFMSIAICILMVSGVFSTTASAEKSSRNRIFIAQRDTDILPIEDPTDFNSENPEYKGGTGSNEGSDKIVGTLKSIITFLKYLIGVLAFSWFIWAGIRMISAGDKEDQAKAAQKGALYSIVALLLVVLIEPLITNTLFGGGAFDPGAQLDLKNIEIAIGAGWLEVIAVVEWVKAFSILLGFAYLLFSAWKFLQDLGGEEEISKQRITLLWMAVGFIVVALDRIIIQEVFYKTFLGVDARVLFEQNAVKGIQEIVGILNYMLQFLGIIAIGIIIYAGFLMITSFGNEENWEKGKKILTASGIGFLIILMSYILVNSVLTGRVL